MSTNINRLPKGSILQKDNYSYDYIDTFINSFRDDEKIISSSDVCRAFFMASPNWVKLLFNIRNKFVGWLGLKTGDTSINSKYDLLSFDFSNYKFSPGQVIGLFKIYNINEKEIVLGQDDKHLDFRVSIFLDPEVQNEIDKSYSQGSAKRNISISTTVKYNNWFGKIYFFPVRPFHKKIVPSMLRSTIKELENKTRLK